MAIEFWPQPHLHEALDRALVVDQARQHADREPESEAEVAAQNLICALAPFMK